MEPTTVALVVFACGRNGDSAGRERVESTCAVRDVRPCLGTLAERRDNRVRLRTANESGSTFNRGTVRYPGTTNALAVAPERTHFDRPSSRARD